MRYKVMMKNPRYFDTLESAIEYANRIFRKTGDMVEIRQAKKKSK